MSIDTEAIRYQVREICARAQNTRDSPPVIAELISVAGDHEALLAEEAGKWAGVHDSEWTAVLVAAIMRDIPGAASWAIATMVGVSDPYDGLTRP